MVCDNKNAGDVFAIPDLWEPSKCLTTETAHSSLLFSQLTLHDIDEKLPEIRNLHQPDASFFSTPDLSFGIVENVPISSQHTDISKELKQPLEKEEDGGIWLLPYEISIKAPSYQSWDSFTSENFKEPHTPYISEAGAVVFDAVVAAKDDNLRVGSTDYIVVDAKVYASAILALGLGRSSVFFAWNEERQSYVRTISKLRISGYTGSLLDGHFVTFLECGNITRTLQSFVEKAYSRNASPGRVALAEAVSTLLATIQLRLSVSASTHQSILQLQSLFHPAHTALTYFQRIVMNISATRSDESMLSTIFEEIQVLEHRTDSLREILLEILSRVSRPWLEFAGEWLGLQREAGLPLTKDGRGKSFVRVDNKEWIDEHGLEIQEMDFVLDYDKIPSFIQPDDARTLFEVGRSLRFIRTHHPDHPLVRTDIVASASPPSLEWKFSWQDILQVEAKALQYEKDLKSALQIFSENASVRNDRALELKDDSNAYQMEFFGNSKEDMQAHVLASIKTFNSPLRDHTRLDPLSSGLNAYLAAKDEDPVNDESIFAPPISLTPFLSFNPIIAAQARIVNQTCMRMFFNSHSLRKHLSLQRSFHLLGNGVFSSRLSHALFDPELESAERHKGIARSGGVMGLRLGGRESWPPASSELRLALMGVLTESYVFNEPLNPSYPGTYLDQTSLPGDLSFAVRDMTPEEIDKCLNPDSVEALDFLRLSYRAPPPIEAVITPVILYKYDQLFKLLLRVLRMLYVVSALFHDATDRVSSWRDVSQLAQRFRIEAHHFISSISSYFFDTGVDATWRIFERKLDQIEERINKGDGITLGQNEGIDKLRDYHERVLDRIMFALLLRKRQQPVLNLLEEIFATILQFSKHSRQRASGLKMEAAADDEVRELYAKFQKKVGVFITVCRGLSEKNGYGDKKLFDTETLEQGGIFNGDDLAEENTIAYLLARLEMSNYYSRSGI